MPSSASVILREQFETPEQQRDVSTLGMWVFLVTEIMFFGGAFTAYTVYRSFYPAAFGEGSNHLDVMLGAVSTAVLIGSSFFMAMAVHSGAVGNRKLLVIFLLLTVLLAGAFLFIEMSEWHELYKEHLMPGSSFHFEGPNPRQVQLFFSMYFATTGLHAMHVSIGIVLLLVMAFRAYADKFSPAYYTPIEMAGLYWHFVDLVWIFLFPLYYLIARHA